MGAASQLANSKLLRGLIPLDGLSPHNFNEVVSRLQLKQVEKGDYVFREGSRDPNAIYLIEGKLELQRNGKKVSVLRGNSHDAAHALAPQQPRPLSALAKTRVTIVFIDKTLLDVYAGTHQANAYEVRDINTSADDDDWMTRLLQSDAFLRLPPMNIQRMLTRMQAVKLNANDIVLKEGDDGDAYYTIKFGRCRVSRNNNGNEVILAELADGACFGEDALLSESKRSATITMVTDGELMRLSKKDFLELLNDPLVDHISYTDAIELINQGAKWLDTRPATEHSAQCITDSLNIPMHELRDKMAKLDKSIAYITYCNDGRTSSAATFVLSQNGISSRALSNGMAAVDTALITIASDTVPTAAPCEPADATPASAEIIGFEQPLGAKQIAEIKLLRSELGNLRKLSETRLQHTKLQAHEQIAKLEKELKLAKNTQGESQNHSQDEIKRLKAALYEEQENAATISTRKLETEHALTKLAEQLNILKKQDEQRQSELKSAQENVIALEQAELAANTAVEQLQAQLLTAEALNNDTNNSRQEQIDQLTSELSEAIDSRKEIESQLHALQQTVEALTENEQQAKQAVEAHLNGIKQLDAKLSEATDTCKHLEEQVHSAQETINALAQDQQQSAKKIQDRLQEIEHLNKKLEEANTAQRQADQEASILRGKLEGSKEAQIEVVSKLKQQIENASAQHQQTNNEREALRTQLSIAEQELSEKQNTVNDLANNIAENKSAIEALTKDRDAALNEKTHLVETLESLKSALNEANNKNDLRIKELTTKVEDSHRSNQSLQQDNNELKLKLEDSSRETERLQVSISGEIDAEIGCLLEEVKIKSSELTRLQSEIDNSTQKTQQLEDKISGLENQLQENQNVYGDRIAELDTALMKSQDAHSVAEESANDHLKSLAQLDEQLKTKENELEKNHERLHTLEQTQQSLQEQIKNYESQLEALQLSQGDSKELTLHLETLNTKNESLCDDLATSEQQLQDINTKLDAAHADAHSIGEELSNLRESITELEKINKTLEENIKSLNADNESLRATLSSTEEKFKSINAELEAAYSDSSSSSEELTELKESIESLQTTKTSLEQKLVELEAAEEENIVLQQRINELDHSKKELAESIENNEADRTETARKLKEFNQEKSIIIEKIGNSEELITALRSELESINNNTEQLKTEFGEATVTSQNTITQLTAQLEQAEAEHEKQIANLKQQLDVQISDHQKTNSTLEEVHSNLRNDRFDLETQLHEQRLLKEQAESIANATKLEIEGLRAELDAANQQLISANNNEPSAADSTQLQRLSSDLAKAVEFRKQSQISKQALQDDISEARKEIARLKGENDGHLELRIQLEGQLSVMRQQLNSGPATNQIFDNLKSLNDVSGIGHIPPTTDIGQTSWESKPAKRYNYIMVIAVFAAFMLIGLGSWLFKSQLGLEEEWETISQKIGLSENSVKTKQDSIAKIETVENRDASTSINQGTAITDTTPSTNITKIANATTQPVEKKASPIKPSSTSKKPLIAVTATSRDVTPIPFRVYRNALKDGGASPVMVEMPSGTFTMGSSVTSDFYEERPHRDVKIARFAVSKREVTFSEYVKFAKAAKKDVPEDEGWGRGNQPVINVSWHDASNYAAWLSEQTGNSYRLPSEAEWEYMARAGTQATYWWGNEPRGNYANCYDCQGKLTGKQALAVESYDANAFGIKNTAGNVAEWVQDCYHANYENAPLDSKAWVTNGICDKRMVRGGSFRSTLSQLRSSARDSFDITTRSESIGFRVVREY